MKKLMLIIIVVFLSHTTVFSMGCLPEGIVFTSQAQIDSFQVNYPGCSVIEGDVTIYAGDITNLNGLALLTSIGGDLWISSTTALSSLSGLGNLTTIGGRLVIYYNAIHSSLSELHSLTCVGDDLDIQYNYSLTSLVGLDHLLTIGGELWIDGNTALNNLLGLENLTTVGSDLRIEGNMSLSNLTGLESVTTIGRSLIIINNMSVVSVNGLNNLFIMGGCIWIEGCHALASLVGLGQINAGTISDLYIENNIMLSTCTVKSICDYLANPHGTVEIQNNATGCNSQQEVEEACAHVGVENTLVNDRFITVYPNPTADLVTIEIPGISSESRLSFFNLSGEEISHYNLTDTKSTIDLSGLPPGIYFCRLSDGHHVDTIKLAIIK